METQVGYFFTTRLTFWHVNFDAVLHQLGLEDVELLQVILMGSVVQQEVIDVDDDIW